VRGISHTKELHGMLSSPSCKIKTCDERGDVSPLKNLLCGADWGI
jgi:hypothetical protein